MALEKQTQQGMPVKQKIMMGAVAVIILIVIWQVIGLLGEGSSSAPPAHVTVPPKVPAKTSVNGIAQPAMNAAPAPASAMNGQATQQAEIRQAQVMSDSRFLQLQQENEQKYLGKINDL